jgi:hypothetical protein
MDDDPFEIPNYPDMLVISFRIPWGRAAAARPTPAARPLREPPAANGWTGPAPADRRREVERAREPGPSAPAPEPRIITAGVHGQPALAVSGVSDGALTLWRRFSDQAPPRALASFTAGLDGALSAADGKFLGWLVGETTAYFDPDWLRGIGAGPVQPVGDWSKRASASCELPDAQAVSAARSDVTTCRDTGGPGFFPDGLRHEPNQSWSRDHPE